MMKSLSVFLLFIVACRAFYAGFDRNKCLGSYAHYKLVGYENARAKMLERSNALEDCSRCLRKRGELKDVFLNSYLFYRDTDRYDLDYFEDEANEKLTPAFCSKNGKAGILERYQTISSKMNIARAKAEWKKETNLTAANNQAALDLTSSQTKEIARLNRLLSSLLRCDNLSCREKQMVYPSVESLTIFPTKLAHEKGKLSNSVQTVYSKAVVCREEDGKEKCYHYEPGIQHIMDTSRDYDELLWVWKGWRDAIGPKVRNNWICEQVIRTIGAKRNGYKDVGEEWRSVYNVDNFEDKMDKLWAQIKPFYQQFHAYIRHKLHGIYGDKVDLKGPIPAHLLGNIWAMNWHGLYNDVKPFKDIDDFQVTAGLKKKKVSVMKMFHLADEFYQSMGLPAMPQSFWKKSMFVRPKDGHPVVCYASAHNLGHTDVRVKMCAEVTGEYFYTAHHEMGHCQYFLAYNIHQPYCFQGGANPGFHEAIGDTAALSVINPNHLTKLGILDKQDEKSASFKKRELNFLMSRALEKLTLFPFALSLEKWRWDFFADRIKDGKINKHWWDRKLQYQGIVPPVKRTEKDFDPAAKYHVSANVPYIRYFFSHVLQFQFYETLCEAADHKGPLYNCDFGGSKDAGKIFKRMLDEGKSKHWKDILKEMTGSCDLSTLPVLKYFKPLHEWLIKENRRLGLHVGW